MDPPSWAGQRFPTAGWTVGNNDFTLSRRPTGKMEFGVGGDSDRRLATTIQTHQLNSSSDGLSRIAQAFLN